MKGRNKMNNNEINILNLISLLKEHNIKDIVISPGGTNRLFVKKVENDSYFNCYSVVDERSAIYFAIGLYLQTGRIIATSCTSAQATRNYIPGLTEAFYKKVPILAITMSKHPRFTYQEYMQAPDQCSLPKDCVKKSYQLPFVSDENDMIHSMRVINEAILELTHHGFGPVQLCIPILDRKTKYVNKNSIKINRFYNSDLKHCSEKLKNKKIMIIIGEHRPFDSNLKQSIQKFCDNYNCYIYTNHLSNFENNYSIKSNLLFSCMKVEDFEKIKPDIIITIGGQTGDYPLYNMISNSEFADIEHWRVSESGDVVDTYDKLCSIFEMSEYDFFNGILNDKITEGNDYYETWRNNNLLLNTEFELPFSNTFSAQVLSKKINKPSIIQFSILNSLRVWNLFSLNENIECYSNVGAFGIDGGMSTLIGQSMVSEKDCYMVIGDLAFLYDINSLSIRNLRGNLKILLVNNNGGVEFKSYGDDDNFEKINKYIAASDHFKNAKGWAETCGFRYISASNNKDFMKNVETFVNDSSKPIVFEIFVKDADELEAYNILIQNNSKTSVSDYGKKIIKKGIKKILNRK